jgi:hypothetical protein
MTFADLVAGDAVFVDANTLTYHFQPHPVWGPACTDGGGHFLHGFASPITGRAPTRLPSRRAQRSR